MSKESMDVWIVIRWCLVLRTLLSSGILCHAALDCRIKGTGKIPNGKFDLCYNYRTNKYMCHIYCDSNSVLPNYQKSAMTVCDNSGRWLKPRYTCQRTTSLVQRAPRVSGQFIYWTRYFIPLDQPWQCESTHLNALINNIGRLDHTDCRNGFKLYMTITKSKPVTDQFDINFELSIDNYDKRSWNLRYCVNTLKRRASMFSPRLGPTRVSADVSARCKFPWPVQQHNYEFNEVWVVRGTQSSQNPEIRGQFRYSSTDFLDDVPPGCHDVFLREVKWHFDSSIPGLCLNYRITMKNIKKQSLYNKVSVKFTLLVMDYGGVFTKESFLEECVKWMSKNNMSVFESLVADPTRNAACKYPWKILPGGFLQIDRSPCGRNTKKIVVDGSQRCSRCLAGSYYNGSQCLPCPPGTYGPPSMAYSCLVCPLDAGGIITPLNGTGAVSVGECPKLESKGKTVTDGAQNQDAGCSLSVLIYLIGVARHLCRFY